MFFQKKKKQLTAIGDFVTAQTEVKTRCYYSVE